MSVDSASVEKIGAMKTVIRFFDMFSGIGGFRAGLERVGGFECIGHCEIDPYANKSYRPTQIEKETIILFNEAENEAEIYTYNQKLISMLKKRPEIANLKRKDNTGAYTFIIPKSYLKINLKRKLSQAELAQRQINMDKINSRRKSRADLTQTTDG